MIWRDVGKNSCTWTRTPWNRCSILWGRKATRLPEKSSNTWPKASNTHSHSVPSPILKPLFIIKIMLSATNHSNRENSGFIQCRKIFQNGLQAPAYLFPDKCTLTLYHSVPISLGQQSPKDQQNLFTWHGYYSLAGNFTPFLHWSMASIFSSISWLSALASICIGHASISFPSSFSFPRETVSTH